MPTTLQKIFNKGKIFQIYFRHFSDVAKKASPNNQSSPAISSSNSFFLLAI